MTKEQFTQLGLTEEQAQKAAEQSAKELEGYIPKHRFDEVNEENKNLKTTISDNEKSLEDLKKSAGDSEELKKQIEQLQNDAKEKEAKYQEELKESKMTSAIKLSLSGIAQDDDLVAGLIDRTKLILADDGKLTGLDEQIKTLRESKSFLFKEEQQQVQKPGFHKLGGNPPGANQENGTLNLRDAIAAKLNV